MKLLDLVERSPVPTPWSEGEKIPWHEPGFSRRMLVEHLSPAHDRASRRLEIVGAQVRWIHDRVLAGRPGRILDLGCGPGLYAERLVRLGHALVGADLSPASIAHAREHVPGATFVLGDMRRVDLPELGPFSLSMLLFGEANAFRKEDLEAILRSAAAALEPAGALLLEVHTLEAVREVGRRPPVWYTATHGLFSDEPHLCLRESFWDETAQTASERWWVVDPVTAEVTRHFETLQAYSEEAYRSRLLAAGFETIARHEGMGAWQEGFLVLVARKPS